MALPSTKPGTIRARTQSEGPSTAKSVAIKCDTCGKIGVVQFVTKGTPMERQALIRAFTEEHRQIGCTGPAEAADRREYKIWYPRA